jgi:hypothetical protein
MQHAGDAEFDRLAGTGREHVDPAAIQVDLDELQVESAQIKSWVDKHIAHTDLKPLKVAPTFTDLSDAIDALLGMFRRYFKLLTGLESDMRAPEPQYDWLAPFRVAWLPDGGDGNQSGGGSVI